MTTLIDTLHQYLARPPANPENFKQRHIIISTIDDSAHSSCRELLCSCQLRQMAAKTEASTVFPSQAFAQTFYKPHRT